MFDHNDLPLTTGVLLPTHDAICHRPHRLIFRRARLDLAARIIREPIFARVIQLIEWHTLIVLIDEAFACMTEAGILHTIARIDIERPGDVVNVRAIVIGVERKIKMIGR